ncbi:MAG: ABC transporter ATP-binding protein [Gemmatimonadota bacterium]
MIEVVGLTKSYQDLVAVRDLSFRVEPGQVIGLVGPNGAGKTTTLRCLSGILPPTTGQVTIAGHDITREPVAAKKNLAFVPDEPQLFDYLTVEEHLQFVSRIYQVNDAARLSGPLLEELELTDHQRKLPNELSRGMRQKLAIACGLIHNPGVLLFDEPLTGLDPVGIRRMKDTILTRARNGASVLLSSHLLHLVEELCTGVVIIARGRLLAYGSIASIVANRPELAGMDLEEVFLAITGSEGSR